MKTIEEVRRAAKNNALVRYWGILYYVIGYEEYCYSDGTSLVRVILHDMKANCEVHAELEHIEVLDMNYHANDLRYEAIRRAMRLIEKERGDAS